MENGKIKIQVISLGPQVLSIEVYVERTPDAAVLVGDRCGRVRLNSHPGRYYPNQVTETATNLSGQIHVSQKTSGVLR